VHDEAAHVEDTDWPQIVALYGLLEQHVDNPMVALNRIVAIAMVHGPDAGLQALDALQATGRLADHHRLDAVRGHLLERAGRPEPAIACYLAAADKTTSPPERRYLERRAARLAAD
jgi:predicted RNA polymerase sigma factor